MSSFILSSSIKGISVSRSALNGISQTLKVGCAVLVIARVGMTTYKIYKGQKSFIDEGGLNLFMGGVVFVPGAGWIVSGSYFGGKALLEYTDNDFWKNP